MGCWRLFCCWGCLRLVLFFFGSLSLLFFSFFLSLVLLRFLAFFPFSSFIFVLLALLPSWRCADRQCAQNITAKKLGSLAWGSHIEGAIQLVKARGRSQLRTKMGMQLFIAVRTQLVSAGDPSREREMESRSDPA